MSKQLFITIQQGYDSRNRIVYIAQDPDSKLYFVYKPRTGFKSQMFNAPDLTRLLDTYNMQLGCSQTSVISGTELEEIPAPQTPTIGITE